MRDTLAPIGTKHFIFSLAKCYSCRLKRKVVVVSYSQDVASLDLKLHSRKTNTSPLNIGHPKRKLVFQPLLFRGELLVLGSVSPGKMERTPTQKKERLLRGAAHTFQLFQTPAPMDMVNIPSNMLLLMAEILHQLIGSFSHYL